MQRALGERGFVLAYVATGAFASLSTLAMIRRRSAHTARRSLGASGAIYAFLTFWVLRRPQARLSMFGMSLSPVEYIFTRLALDYGLHECGANIDYASHAGGAVAGFMLYMLVTGHSAVVFLSLMAMAAMMAG